MKAHPLTLFLLPLLLPGAAGATSGKLRVQTLIKKLCTVAVSSVVLTSSLFAPLPSLAAEGDFANQIQQIKVVLFINILQASTNFHIIVVPE